MKSALSKRKQDDNSSYWLKKADELWGLHIHQTYNETCAFNSYGPCAGKNEAHHMISRSVRGLRHDPECGILLCSLHHKYCLKHSPHASPLGFAAAIQNLYPDKWAWFIKNKWFKGKFNYHLAYETLRVILYGPTRKEPVI